MPANAFFRNENKRVITFQTVMPLVSIIFRSISPINNPFLCVRISCMMMCIGYLCKHNIGMKAPPSVCIYCQQVCCQPIYFTEINQIIKIIPINFLYQCKNLVQNSFLLRFTIFLMCDSFKCIEKFHFFLRDLSVFPSFRVMAALMLWFC